MTAVSSAGAAQDPPNILPGERSAHPAQPGFGEIDEWIVAGRPGERARAVAAVHRATPLGGPGNTWLLDPSRATAFARDLKARGLFFYAEPNVPAMAAGYPDDRYAPQQWWLKKPDIKSGEFPANIVDADRTTPPRVTKSSPTLALIERSADPLHPDLASARLENPAPIGPIADLHGTIVAAIAGSPAENGGIRGVWPGMKMRLFESGEDCASSTRAVYRAARAGSPVINMSYGFRSNGCFTHFQATEFAVHKGSLPVAAAGNTFKDEKNISMRPATDPHVLSVSAIDKFGVVADFATRNQHVDLTAPGVALWAPYVTTLQDGSVLRDHRLAYGTSFSAPMVSAAATWLRQARKGLSARQISRILTSSARDLGSKGWDQSYGAGLLDIEAALRAPTPPDDALEPNDDIGWVNGSLLRNNGKPIRADRIYRPGLETRELVRATLSKRDDPVDVYRLRIGREATVVFRVDQLAGDVAVRALRLEARNVADGKGIFAASDRTAPKPEGIKVVNRSRKAQDFYMAISPGRKQGGLYSRYRITVQSIR